MISVIKNGVQITIQDLGRDGFRHLGVSKAGSLDPYGQIIANRLIGNNDSDAVLEVTVGLTELLFNCNTVIALQGAHLNAMLDDHPIYPGWSYQIKNKQKLSFKTSTQGMRVYIAVKGGINAPLVMGSCATDLNAQFGGLEGRALIAGDEIPITPYDGLFIKTGAMNLPARNFIRVHPGPHAHLLGKQLITAFEDTLFQTSHKSNRMGVRLEHNTNHFTHSHSLPSLAVSPGSIQLPPNGEPIVLLNDAQTTGGYPLLGTIIDADLHQFAQLRPGDGITFKYVSLEQAAKAKQKINAHLNKLSLALKNNK